MVIAIIITTENTNNSAIRDSFPHTQFTMIYLAITTGTSLHPIAHGDTTTLSKANPIPMNKTTDNIRDLMTGEIKSRNNSVTSIEMITATIMKIMNRPEIKEKDESEIISKNSAVTRTI
jgi:hypothetical protein